MISTIPRRAVRVGLALVAIIGAGALLSSCDLDLSAVLPPCTHTWTGPADGDFGTATNWDTATVPGATDRACADPGTTIVVTTPQSVGSLDLQGTVTIPVGSSLGVTDNAYVSAVADLRVDGTMDNAAILLVGGISLPSGGTVQGNGGTLLVGSHASSFSGGRFSGFQFLSVGSVAGFNGSLQLCDSAVMRVTGDLSIDAPTDITTGPCPSAGDPRLQVTSSGRLTLGADLTTDLAVENAGEVTVNGSGFAAKSYDQTAGSTTLGPGSDLVLDGGAGLATIGSGTFTGTGAVTGNLAGAGTFVPGNGAAGTLTVHGDFTPGGNLEFELAGTDPGVSMAAMVVDGVVDVTAANLVATLYPGYAPLPTDSFPLITPTQPMGPFAGSTVPAPFGVIYGSSGLRVGPSCNALLYYPGINLDGQDLTGADLNHCDLTGASFVGTNLTGADLSGSTLHAAVLTDANLNGANLNGSDLSTADLSNANLANANLAHADLSGVALTNATISGANLQSATGINTVTGLLGTVAHGWSGTDLGGTGLDLHGQNITNGGVDTTLDGVDLSGADLSGADLSGASLANSDLTGVNLSGAQLPDSNLYSAKLNGTDLSNASLPNAYLESARFGGTNLVGADLSYDSGNPYDTLLAVYGNTTCPSTVNSDDNGGNCEGQWPSGG